MIVFTNVTKQFGDEVPALDDVSFEISEGEIAVITGPSGSGKTSLMRLLTKEYQPDTGEVTFQEQPLSQIRRSEVHLHRRKIGVVFQDYKLLPELNVWENIALALSIIGAPTHEIESRVTDLLKLVNLTEKAFHFPTQLSGGEAQRVSIARALSTAPHVIFADEPTGNLDPETSASIVQLLAKINKLGTTVMITTHDPIILEVLKAPRHIILEQGKITKDSHGKKSSKPKTVSIVVTEDLKDSDSKPDEKRKIETENRDKEQEESEKVIVEITTLDDETPNKPADPTPTQPATKKRISLKLPGFITGLKKQKEHHE